MVIALMGFGALVCLTPAVVVAASYLPMLRLVTDQTLRYNGPVPDLSDPLAYSDAFGKKALAFSAAQVIEDAMGTHSYRVRTKSGSYTATVNAAPLVRPGSKLVSSYACRCPSSRSSGASCWTFPALSISASTTGRRDWLEFREALQLTGVSSGVHEKCQLAAEASALSDAFSRLNLTENPVSDRALIVQMTDFAMLEKRLRILIWVMTGVLTSVTVAGWLAVCACSFSSS